MKRFLSIDPAEGGDPLNQNPAPTPSVPPAPAPPSAADAVLNGDRTERELKLQEDLQRERTDKEKALAEKKARETKIAELEDQITRFNSSPASAARPDNNWDSDLFDV